MLLTNNRMPPMSTTTSPPSNILETTREGLLARCDFLEQNVPQLRTLVGKARGYIAMGELSAAHGCLFIRASVAAKRDESPQPELHGLARVRAALKAEAEAKALRAQPQPPQAELTGLARTRAALEREARLRGVLDELKRR